MWKIKQAIQSYNLNYPKWFMHGMELEMETYPKISLVVWINVPQKLSHPMWIKVMAMLELIYGGARISTTHVKW